MKYSIKKLTTVSALSTMLILAACSHENPLTTQPLEDSARFIDSASESAAKAAGYKGHNAGDAYRFCFTEDYKDKSYCDELLEGMVAYAKQSDGPFASVTVKDLQNQAFIDSLMHTAYWFNVAPF